MKSTFSVIFYLKKEKLKKDGTYPIMGRITVDGTQAQFGTKLSIGPKLWASKGGRAAGKSVAAREVNHALDKIRSSITGHYQEIMDRDNYVTAEKVRNAFQGLEYRFHTLMRLYDDYLEAYEKKVSCGLKSRNTLSKYKAVYRHLREFLQLRYHTEDIALKEIKPSFMSDFETFLITDKHLGHNTVWAYSFPPRMLLHRAVENGWLIRYPFGEYEIYKEETEKGFLTQEELKLLLDAPKMNFKRTFVRDMFLFCCFTGLAHIDLLNLREENIVTNPIDGGTWIHTFRQKTGVEVNVKLLDIPLQILEKYKGLCNDGRVFPVMPYNSCKAILRTVCKKCGIDRHLTWHMARHTMATVVCLSNGMPLETVSALLGHKCIKSTQIYAKITNEKINREMDLLSDKLACIGDYVSTQSFR